MGHTQGPWEFRPDSDGYQPIAECKTITIQTVDGMGSLICEVYADTEDGIATAHMLKAAPDLLTALETYQTVLAELQQTNFSSTAIAAWTRLGHAATRAQQAIAKAKGAL